MIISASRRTDIPAYYSDWFFERLRAGRAIARNPFNPKQGRVVPLDAGEVGGFVFWSKNPQPMIGRLHRLGGYPYYFQYTLNAYGSEIEPAPPLDARLETLRRLSGLIGPKRVVWRYDPILLNETYTESWHADAFCRLAAALGGHVGRVVISFLDIYGSIAKILRKYGIEAVGEEQMRSVASAIAPIALSAGMKIEACAESADLSPYGITRGRCIDADLLGEIAAGCGLSGHVKAPAPKDRNQRPECGCARSVDIGAYGTCRCGCIYCYARYLKR
jgi:hypothetical protein